MGFRVLSPAPNTGYNRTTDWPTKGGSGGTVGFGSTLSSTITAPGGSQWHPTVAWMLGFVVAELIIFHLLSGFLNI